MFLFPCKAGLQCHSVASLFFFAACDKKKKKCQSVSPCIKILRQRRRVKVAATEAAEGITAVARAESGIGEGKMSWKGGMVDDVKCGKVERKDEMVEREGGMVDVGKCGKIERKDGMVGDGKCGKVERKDGMVEREGGIVDDGKCGKVERKDGMMEREGAMAWWMMVNVVRWKGKME